MRRRASSRASSPRASASSGPTIDAGLPWLSQSIALFSPQELRGLLASLTPAVQGTSATLTATQSLLNGSDELARCLTHDIIPTGNQRISDPPVTTGLQVYQELFQSAVGLAASAQNIDGNGRYLRASTGGGDRPGRHRLAAGRRTAVRQRGAAAAGHPPGVRRHGADGALRRGLLSQSGARAEPRHDGNRTVKRAILTHRFDFAAIAALFVGRDRRHAVHPRAPAVVRVRPELLHGARAVRHRRRGHPRPGPGGDDRRGPGRADRGRVAAGRPRGGDDEHLQEVPADLQQRHGAAAAAHAAEGHVPGARPGHPQRRRGAPGRDALGRQHQPRRGRLGDPLLAGRRRAQLPDPAARRRCPGVPRPRRHGRGADPGGGAGLQGTLKRFEPLDRDTAALRRRCSPSARRNLRRAIHNLNLVAGVAGRRRGTAGVADPLLGHELPGDRDQRRPARADPAAVPRHAAADAASRSARSRRSPAPAPPPCTCCGPSRATSGRRWRPRGRCSATPPR